MEAAETILSCPFCGSHGARLTVQAEEYAVVCEACGAVGPEDQVEDFAVQRWNSRSALAASFRSPARAC